MKPNKINFGNEVCINLELSSRIDKITENVLIDYEVNNNTLFLIDGNNFIPAEIKNAYKDDILIRFSSYKEHSLLRVDSVNSLSLVVTFISFSEVLKFDNETPFVITIDHAFETAVLTVVDKYSDKEKIKSNPSDFLNQQIKVDNSSFCFAMNGNNGKITLIGERYLFQLEKTPRNTIHIINILKRRNNQEYTGAITLFSGSIIIQDFLNDKSVLKKEASEKYELSIKGNQEIIDIWRLYDELEIETLKNEAVEMGFYKYSRRASIMGENGNDKWTFIVDKNISGSFFREGCNYEAVAIDNFNKENPFDYKYGVMLGEGVDINCKFTNKFIIEIEDIEEHIPAQGYLVPSLTGSKAQSKRRRDAQNRIIKGNMPLIGLKLLLQTGECIPNFGKHRSPISDKVQKDILGKNISFTENQKKAIDIAVNTPDIAIIQGPPGTGKTTVIRVIISRLNELYKGSIKILVSSAQHDAVDNAIERLSYHGLPANRMGGRFKSSPNSHINDWINNLAKNCDVWLQEDKSVRERISFRKIFTLLDTISNNSVDAQETSNHFMELYKLLEDIGAESEILLEVSNLRARIGSLKSEAKNESPMLEELKYLLSLQRIDKISFLDDGAEQIKKMISFLNNNRELEFNIPNDWKKLRRIKDDSDELDTLLDKYAESINVLEERYVGDPLYSTDLSLLKRDILNVISNIKCVATRKGNDAKEQLSNLIWDFRTQLTNKKNIERIIDNYSSVNAATCQQAASRINYIDENGKPKEYDYVIIDEAARANPLDLLIPMSMGKRIILVGDQQQLPHMIEPDIVKKLVLKTLNTETEKLLKESLFERLYKSLLKNTSNIPEQRTIMLNEQYRMHPDICRLVNQFYNNKLKTMCKKEDKDHNLELYNNKALVWLDVNNKESYCGEKRYNTSICRPSEADIVINELQKILDMNSEFNVGIITFYKGQQIIIENRTNDLLPSEMERIRIGTVDSFQGKEFDVVILSTVRSNQKKEVGFLTSKSRLCVAFSRAKRLFITIGDSETITIVQELKTLYDLCRSDGYYERKN